MTLKKKDDAKEMRTGGIGDWPTDNKAECGCGQHCVRVSEFKSTVSTTPCASWRWHAVGRPTPGITAVAQVRLKMQRKREFASVLPLSLLCHRSACPGGASSALSPNFHREKNAWSNDKGKAKKERKLSVLLIVMSGVNSFPVHEKL